MKLLRVLLVMKHKKKMKNEILPPLSNEGRKVMERKSSDNKYLHKDFHISQNILMDYIQRSFGAEALINYLEQYTVAYHNPLNQKIKQGNIGALLNYFIEIYKKEEWPVKISSDENYIEIEQDACPGISHIRSGGGEPCLNYRETYYTIYRTLCEGTPFEYILKYFNDETGACKQLFLRKEGKQ